MTQIVFRIVSIRIYIFIYMIKIYVLIFSNEVSGLFLQILPVDVVIVVVVQLNCPTRFKKIIFTLNYSIDSLYV